MCRFQEMHVLIPAHNRHAFRGPIGHFFPYSISKNDGPALSGVGDPFRQVMMLNMQYYSHGSLLSGLQSKLQMELQVIVKPAGHRAQVIQSLSTPRIDSHIDSHRMMILFHMTLLLNYIWLFASLLRS